MKLYLMALSLLMFIPALSYAEVPKSNEQVTLSYAPLVKKIAPAVVNIYTKRMVEQRAHNPFMNDPFFSQFFGRNHSFGGLRKNKIENSLGSGVIIDKEGVVITNSHVIKGADEITVILSDGREFEARVALEDAKIDLAILRMDIDGEDLPTAKLRPSENMEVGDLVIAIGNPFGVGQTVTSGIISAVARSAMSVNDFNFFIQTDAAINPGNSGGALVAMDGGIIGINTAIYSRSGGSLGIGFAIPSEMAETMIAAEKSGHFSSTGFIRPWLGVTSQNLTNDMAESLGLKLPHGAMIVQLHKNSPMKKSGLDTGDIITSINGKNVKSSEELRFRMSMIPIGETARIEAISKGKNKIFKVKSIAPSNKPAPNPTKIEGKNILSGATIANLNPAISYEMGMSVDATGIFIKEIEKRSYAERFLQAGDILIEINENKIESIKDAQNAVKDNKQSFWKIVFSRGGKLQTLVLR